MITSLALFSRIALAMRSSARVSGVSLNTYSRLYPNKQAEVAQQLENLINGTTVPDTIIKKEKELLRALLIQFCKLEVCA